jgi:hypothetical protein
MGDCWRDKDGVQRTWLKNWATMVEDRDSWSYESCADLRDISLRAYFAKWLLR